MSLNNEGTEVTALSESGFPRGERCSGSHSLGNQRRKLHDTLMKKDTSGPTP